MDAKPGSCDTALHEAPRCKPCRCLCHCLAGRPRRVVGRSPASYDPAQAELCSELAGDTAQGPATPGHQHPTECPCATLCFGGGTTGVEPETVAPAHPGAATSASSPAASATEHHPRLAARPTSRASGQRLICVLHVRRHCPRGIEVYPMSRNLRSHTGRARPLLALSGALLGAITLIGSPATAQDVKLGDSPSARHGRARRPAAPRLPAVISKSPMRARRLIA